MGLDITAHEKLTPLIPKDDVEEAQLRHDYEWGENNVVRAYVEPHFRAAADNLTEGYYRSEGVKFRFHAGSYSGYNFWRERLAALVGLKPADVWKDPQPGPFVELINFSDCEGTIGPETSAKLTRDFERFRPVAMQKGEELSRVYDLFERAFRLASNGGAVMFS